jgi:hypothetical protein
MIKGIWADEANQFHPEQWVNVYEISPLGAIYYSSCQVKHLDLEELGGWDYGIEPTDEDGNVMSMTAALLLGQQPELLRV